MEILPLSGHLLCFVCECGECLYASQNHGLQSPLAGLTETNSILQIMLENGSGAVQR